MNETTMPTKELPVFTGQFEHSVDSKGRVVIPSVFRNHFEPVMKLARHMDGCLVINTQSGWSDFVRKHQKEIKVEIKREKDAGRRALLQQKLNYTIRALNANAVDVELDKAGRINIPAKLIKLAEIGTNVIVSGNLNVVEIWNPDKLEEIESFFFKGLPDFEALREVNDVF